MKRLRKIKRYLVSVARAVSQEKAIKGSRIAVFFDVIYCNLRFHASLSEYFSFGFYNYKDRYRKNFMLAYHQRNQYMWVNDVYLTHSKYSFYTRFIEFFGREMILLPECGEEAFLRFVKTHKFVVLKPNNGSLGKGIVTLAYENDEQVLQRFRDINSEMVCEEYIHQHRALSELNPFSVNTLRIVSVRHNEDDIEIVSATLRTGAQQNSFVDNMACGGIIAQVDCETGIVCSYGTDHSKNRYAYHPITKKQLVGMNIPNWFEAIDLVKRAHSKLHENLVVGFDIAITETGVDIVEANSAPSADVMQMADLMPKGEKILAVLNDKKNQVYRRS